MKVNFAVDRLPKFASNPDFDPEVHGGTIVLAESRCDDVEHAFQEAVAGAPADAAVRRHLHPAGLRPTPWHRRAAHRVDVHPVGAAHLGSRAARGRARGVRRPGRRPAGGRGAGVHRLGSAPAGHRPARDGARVRTGRRQHLPRRADARADVPCRPAAGYADLRTPIDGLYQAGSGTHGGGGVTGIPGRNVVRQVLADRRRALGRRRRPEPSRDASGLRRLPRRRLSRRRCSRSAQPRCCRREAYTRSEVLAWERRHLFAGDLDVPWPARRAAVDADGDAVTQRALTVGDVPVLLTFGDGSAVDCAREHLPAPRPRAARRRCDRDPAVGRLPVPRLDLRPRRRARPGAADAARSRTSTGGVARRWSSCPSRSGTAGCSSTRPVTPAPFAEHVGALTGLVAPYPPETPDGRRPARTTRSRRTGR